MQRKSLYLFHKNKINPYLYKINIRVKKMFFSMKSLIFDIEVLLMIGEN
jgi:hypothetical protein